MNIVTLKCPHCEAPLQVNSELTRAVCNYCGNSFVLEDEIRGQRKAGFEFECGRYDAVDSVAAETADKLRALRGPIKECNHLRKELKSLTERIQWMQRELQDDGSLKAQVIFCVTGGLCLFFAILSVIYLGSGWRGLLIGFVLLGVFIVCGRLYKTYEEISITKKQEELEEMEERRQQCRDRIKEIQAEHDIDFVPRPYQTPAAMKYLYNALRSKQAVTLSQAITLYQKELHRRKMIEMQEEQLRLQEEQLLAQREQAEAIREQSKAMLEMEEERREEEKRDAAGRIVGSIVTAGIGIAIGKGIGRFLDEL